MSSDPSFPPFARALIASCKEDVAPERGAERMLATLGKVAWPSLEDGGPAPTNAPGAGVVAQGTVTNAVLAKWVVVAALGGAVLGASGYHVARGQRDVAPAPPISAATIAVPPAMVAPPSSGTADPKATVPSPPLTAPRVARLTEPTLATATAPPATSGPSPAKGAQTDGELAREMAQVTYTRSLIEQKHYAEALQAVAAYRGNLGKVLEPEMRALEVEATFGLGRSAEGRILAQGFLDDYPRHPAASRVRGLMQRGSAPP